jgi:plasmid stabilization system protein ParE
MKRRRYVLAPQAARDLVAIWRYLNKEAGQETANRVEGVIREKFVQLASFPGAGHQRSDLTDAPVRFFLVYSYLIVYRPETNPIEIVTILHGSRDLAAILKKHA